MAEVLKSDPGIKRLELANKFLRDTSCKCIRTRLLQFLGEGFPCYAPSDSILFFAFGNIL